MIYSTLFDYLMVTLGRCLLLLRWNLLHILEEEHEGLRIVSSIRLTHIILFNVNITQSEQVALRSHSDSVWCGPSNVWLDGWKRNCSAVLVEGKGSWSCREPVGQSWGHYLTHTCTLTDTRTHSKHLQGSSLSSLQNRLPGKDYIIANGRSWPADIYSCWQSAHTACIYGFFFLLLREWHHSCPLCCCVNCRMDFITFSWSERSRSKCSPLHSYGLLMGRSELAEGDAARSCVFSDIRSLSASPPGVAGHCCTSACVSQWPSLMPVMKSSAFRV